jgi:antiviral helicase SLH1
MSPSLENAESQWLEQFAAMRAAIAELGLPNKDQGNFEYGKDIVIDDEDEPLNITSVDDLWDLISEVSEEPISSEEQVAYAPESSGEHAPTSAI